MTNPNVASGLLGALAQSDAVISLGIEIAGELIPIAKGTIAEIKQIVSGKESVSYSVLIQGDDANLATVESMSDADLAAINAELARLGKPALSVPVTDAPPASPSTISGPSAT